jgi:uncharacterized protein YndB with AHSA1/START domain
MTDEKTRAFEMTVEIAVPPEAVWQALVDAEDLVRWFPLDATVKPGRGGQWLISWGGQWPWTPEIEIWEPKHHLRLVDRAGRPYDAEGKAVVESAAPMEIAIDWHIEGAGGTTKVRLVHSGFGRGGAWDDEFEGVSVGWQLELNGLKHYLEHHRGSTRRVAWNRTVIAASPQAAWARLTAPDGILREASVLALRPGDRYATTLSTGDRLEGTVLVAIPHRAIQVTVGGWNNALYRLWVDRVGHESSLNSWLSAYDMPEVSITAFDARMRAEIERMAALISA